MNIFGRFQIRGSWLLVVLGLPIVYLGAFSGDTSRAPIARRLIVDLAVDGEAFSTAPAYAHRMANQFVLRQVIGTLFRDEQQFLAAGYAWDGSVLRVRLRTDMGCERGPALSPREFVQGLRRWRFLAGLPPVDVRAGAEVIEIRGLSNNWKSELSNLEWGYFCSSNFDLGGKWRTSAEVISSSDFRLERLTGSALAMLFRRSEMRQAEGVDVAEVHSTLPSETVLRPSIWPVLSYREFVSLGDNVPPSARMWRAQTNLYYGFRVSLDRALQGVHHAAWLRSILLKALDGEMPAYWGVHSLTRFNTQASSMRVPSVKIDQPLLILARTEPDPVEEFLINRVTRELELWQIPYQLQWADRSAANDRWWRHSRNWDIQITSQSEITDDPMSFMLFESAPLWFSQTPLQIAEPLSSRLYLSDIRL